MMLPSLGITDLWTYVLGALFIVLLPGPNSVFVLATSAQRGVANGYKAASAVFLGDAILMLLSALGIASLLQTVPMLFVVLKYLGAAYLLYLGIGMLRSAWRKLHAPDAAAQAVESHAQVGSPFGRALFLSLSNPKAILFFLSFFIQFVDPGYAYPGLSFLVLGSILEAISFLYMSFLIFCGMRLAEWFRQRQRLSAGARTGVGAMFVGFGLKLAGATLT
jgi:leucine efflux protein